MDRTIATPAPRSPTSGFSTTGQPHRWANAAALAQRCASERLDVSNSKVATKPGSRSIPRRISDFDSPTKPPAGIPGLEAVNTVSDRCRTAR